MLKNRDQYGLAVNVYFDHVHFLFDYNLEEPISDLVREIKKTSSNFIKERKLCRSKFEWQSGYGLFSVGWKEKEQMIKYIINQDEHHKKRSFKEEYLAILTKNDIYFNSKYLFEFMDTKVNLLSSLNQKRTYLD